MEGAGAGGRPAPRHHGGPGGRGGVPAVQVAHQLLVYRRARPAPEHVETPAHRALPVSEPEQGILRTRSIKNSCSALKVSLEADLGEGGSPLVSSLLQAMAAPSSSSRSRAHMPVSTGVLASCSPPHMYRVSPITLTPCEDLCQQCVLQGVPHDSDHCTWSRARPPRGWSPGTPSTSCFGLDVVQCSALYSNV